MSYEPDGQLLQRLGVDSNAWAHEYVWNYGGNFGILNSWFANAIMAGYDDGRRNSGTGNLTFWELRNASLDRLPHFKNAFGHPAHAKRDGSDWTINDWTTALMGEVGEFANLAKKLRRGDYVLDEVRGEMSRELADVACYLVLLAHRCEIDLEDAIRTKFNEVSARVGSDVKL
jgi:NTP pyrophosphatase (non-canonical NTP hydrolase)